MLEREREQLVGRARSLRPDGLVVGMSGNLSVRGGGGPHPLTLEWLCALYYRATILGKPRMLSGDEMDRVAVLMETYGRSVPG